MFAGDTDRRQKQLSLIVHINIPVAAERSGFDRFRQGRAGDRSRF